jgi:uncharacterized membrane protein (UPF0136 family)
VGVLLNRWRPRVQLALLPLLLGCTALGVVGVVVAMLVVAVNNGGRGTALVAVALAVMVAMVAMEAVPSRRPLPWRTTH